VSLFLRSADRRPDPPPLRTNDRAAVRFGMAVWTVLLVTALLLRDRLESQGRGWWVWTPVVALLLGCYGLHYIRRREERGPVSRRPAVPDDSPPSSG